MSYQSDTETSRQTYPRFASDLTERDLTMSAEDLAKESRYPMLVLDNKAALYSWLAREMADEIKQRNAMGEPTRWLLPVGLHRRFAMK